MSSPGTQPGSQSGSPIGPQPDNFAQHNIEGTIENQLYRSFIDLRQDKDWQVIRAYKCKDEQYKTLEHYTNYYGTYVIETLAVRNINGPNKHGAYNKSAKGDIVKDYVIVLTDGKVIHESMVLVPAEKREKRGSTALTLHSSDFSSQTGWTEIVCGGS